MGDVHDADEPNEPQALQVFGAPGIVTTVFVPRTLEMYTVTDQELSALANGAQSVHVAFFGVAFGALLIAVVTVATVQLDQTTKGLFAVGAVLAGILSAYFGVRAVVDLRGAGSRVRDIRRNRRL